MCTLNQLETEYTLQDAFKMIESLAVKRENEHLSLIHISEPTRPY